MKHLATIARSAGIRELIAEVLPENGPMLKVFKKCGFAVETPGGETRRRSAPAGSNRAWEVNAVGLPDWSGLGPLVGISKARRRNVVPSA